jgi:hypothetical protein
VFGFGGKKYGERLIYIAHVTAKLEGDAYYRQREYSRRPDCIYRSENGQAVRRASAKYHFESDHRKKDVGIKFENAFVLLSDDFRYLGKRGTDGFKTRYPTLCTLIENLKQGHRRHHSDKLRNELLALKKEIWDTYPRMKVGIPADKDRSRPCNGDSPSASC